MTAPRVDRRILFFGDSFVAGTGDPEGRGWVGRVAAATWAAGLPMLAYPLGVRRETSVQVAERWRAEAAPRLLEGADCRVVFSFGTNDATLEGGGPRVAPGVSVATLGRVLDEAAQRRLPAFVVGPATSCDDEQDARIAVLSRSLAQVCAVRGVPFVAVTDALAASAAWRDEAAAGDGVHPGACGYAALARLVLAGGWLDWLR
ncbi:MAG TPA: GDSL-type esterase/lipase family protein [Solirubrobacteraceae bacterium]